MITSHGFALGLTCFQCGAEYPATGPESVCDLCVPGPLSIGSGILDVRYDYRAAAQVLRAELAHEGPVLDVFRYWPLLPLPRVTSTGEVSGEVGRMPRTGGTPYFETPSLARRLGLETLRV